MRNVMAGVGVAKPGGHDLERNGAIPPTVLPAVGEIDPGNLLQAYCGCMGEATKRPLGAQNDPCY
jgi:hypothetical protein